MATDWFEDMMREYEDRHAAMWAFSNAQIAEKFAAWGEAPPAVPLTGWTSAGMGLILRADIADEFLARMANDGKAHRDTLPAVTVEHVGTDYWDRARYRVTATDEGTGARVGDMLADVALLPPGEAVELHTLTREGEPIAALEARIVYASAVAS